VIVATECVPYPQISVPIGYEFGWSASRSKRKWLGCAGFSVRQVGSQRNGQEQAEALVQLLLEPVGRRQRQKVIALLDT
jgi:hypothetical protein